MNEDILDKYFIGQQFRVDVTIELTKIVLVMQPKFNLDCISEEKKGKTLKYSMPILYNTYGKIVYN